VRTAPVYRITGVRRGLSEDVRGRQRRYLISMGVRTLCFLLALVTSGWLRWAFLSGAVLLPYVAVVLANAGREPNSAMPGVAVHDPARVLEAGPARAVRPGADTAEGPVQEPR
jgi:hypothetical protein